MNDVQRAFVKKAYSSALQSDHIWPGAAAAEAALESAWGTSKLAIEANNLFGLKKPKQLGVFSAKHLQWPTLLRDSEK